MMSNNFIKREEPNGSSLPYISYEHSYKETK